MEKKRRAKQKKREQEQKEAGQEQRGGAAESRSSVQVLMLYECIYIEVLIIRSGCDGSCVPHSLPVIACPVQQEEEEVVLTIDPEDLHCPISLVSLNKYIRECVCFYWWATLPHDEYALLK